MTKRRNLVLMLLAAFLALGAMGCAEDGDDGDKGEQGEQGPPGEPGEVEPTTSVETCIGCHGDMAVRPVGDISDPDDVHGRGVVPLETLVIEITEVDLTGTSVRIEFLAETEMGDPVDFLRAGDGRFTIAELVRGMTYPSTSNKDPDVWVPYITRVENPSIGPGVDPKTQGTAEQFDVDGGTFTNNMDGSYTYVSDTSNSNPQDMPIVDGDTIRVAIQIDADDSSPDPAEHVPAGNGWCDFEADLSSPNDGCLSETDPSRDIVQTDTCNGCHGVTSDVRLALHGGGRLEVEYCVTCHNPTTFDADSGNSVSMPILVHNIHNGADLPDGYTIWGFRDNEHDYSHVEFTKDITDCANCHQGGGADEGNWSTVPSIEACSTSCHQIDIARSGTSHNEGNQQTDNSQCAECHPQSGPIVPEMDSYPVETVHRGAALRAEAERWEFRLNEVDIEDVGMDGEDDLVIEWEIARDGTPIDVPTAPEWVRPDGARLVLLVAWPTDDYTNEPGDDPAPDPPSGPFEIDVLAEGFGPMTPTQEIGSTNEYVTAVPLDDLPDGVEGTIGVAMTGRGVVEIAGEELDFPVVNKVAFLDVEGGRSVAMPRRTIVDVDQCNQCHDLAGQGISLHGANRTGEIQACVMCHNGNNTDISRRFPDPMDALDGKKEEAIDFGRMIHQIHTGAELEEGLVVYGFGFPRTAHDFGHVEFIGNRRNCETCHVEANTMGTGRNYGTLAASDRVPTTIDTGPTSTPGAPDGDPGDDLNISPTAAICSSCHDSGAAKDHMKLHGASFQALDDDIL